MRAQPYALLKATLSQAATTADIVAAITGRKIVVWRILISTDATQDMSFLSASTAILELDGVPVGGYYMPVDGHPIIETVAGEALRLTSASQCKVTVWYTSGEISYTSAATKV